MLLFCTIQFIFLNSSNIRLEIKEAFQHSWNNYKSFAWGYDEIQPLDGGKHDNWGGVGVTMIDALDTAILMNMHKEVQDATLWIRYKWSFQKDHFFNVFEMTIRVLGGLISAYELTHNPLFLNKANEVALSFVPAFNGSKLPLSEVNTLKKMSRNGYTNLAQQGSVQLEFYRLAFLTKNKLFMNAADSWSHIYNKAIRPISLNAEYDSLHEYVLKMYLMNTRNYHIKKGYNKMLNTIYKSLLIRCKSAIFLKAKNKNYMDHLSCFTPGMIALGILTNTTYSPNKDLNLAKKLTTACYRLYNTPTGLSGDKFTISSRCEHCSCQIKTIDSKYALRPETVESLFYMWRLTKNEKYRAWGYNIFKSIQKHCYAKFGYAALKNVFSGEKSNEQPTFWMAELLKYLWLLFSDDNILDLNKWILNTEAHFFAKEN